MQTNIYHMTYSAQNKEADLFFWGCNINCRGCYCKRRIYSTMLDDFLGAHLESPTGLAEPPKRFLPFEEVLDLLSQFELESIIFDGQEASTDPTYYQLTEAFHEYFSSYNTLLTNALELPDLEHTDKIEVGLKAITDSLHRHYTGVSNAPILKNLRKIYDTGKKLLVESVLIPDYIEADEVERVARFVAGIDSNIPFVILPYFQAGNNPWRRPTPSEMEMAADLVKRHLKNVFFFRGNETLNFRTKSIFPKFIEQNICSSHPVEEEKAPIMLQ